MGISVSSIYNPLSMLVISVLIMLMQLAEQTHAYSLKHTLLYANTPHC